MVKESTLQSRCADWLADQPDVWPLKVHGGPYQRANIPDYLLCVGGVFCGIELKVPGEQPTPGQALELRAIARAGGVSGVATTLAEFIALVNLARARIAKSEGQKEMSDNPKINDQGWLDVPKPARKRR